MPVVFIVNSDPSLRETLASVICAGGWRSEVFADAHAFLRHPRAGDPACLVLDADLPDMCGLHLQALCADRPELPVIFTATYPALRLAVLAMKAGAVEFLSAPADEALLLSAVRAAIDRSRAALVQGAVMRVLCARYESLSQRERQVMARVISGRMNKVIAAELGISVITVKAHRGKVMRKMKAASLPQLVNMATRLEPAFLAGDEACSNASRATGGVCSGLPHFQWPLHPSPAFPGRPAIHPAR
ncbi:MAG: LuxR C-terminal-related transcriptional regulator [Gammaproteobacteria bacterium]